MSHSICDAIEESTLTHSSSIHKHQVRACVFADAHRRASQVYLKVLKVRFLHLKVNRRVMLKQAHLKTVKLIHAVQSALSQFTVDDYSNREETLERGCTCEREMLMTGFHRIV